MKITWLGTASLRIETEGERILFDPFVQLAGGANPNTLEDFLGDPTIFVTHNHPDHAFFVPLLLDEEEATVFATKSTAEFIGELAESTETVAVLQPGMEIPVGDASVSVYQGKHIKFDAKTILSTLNPARLARHPKNAAFLAYSIRKMKENGETVAYEVHAEGKTVMILGSMGLDGETEYPTGADLLVLPYQGSSKLVDLADEIIGKLQPKRVMLSHFDDAYPPVSRNVDTRPLKQMMEEKYPEIPVCKPSYGKSIEI